MADPYETWCDSLDYAAECDRYGHQRAAFLAGMEAMRLRTVALFFGCDETCPDTPAHQALITGRYPRRDGATIALHE